MACGMDLYAKQNFFKGTHMFEGLLHVVSNDEDIQVMS